MAKKNEVVKTEETALAENQLSVVPDYIESGAIGAEAIGANDINVPKIKLLQSIHDEVMKDKLPVGTFFNTATGETAEEIEIIPLLVDVGLLMFDGEGKDAKLSARKFARNIMSPVNAELLNDPTVTSWKKDAKGKDIKPQATITYVYVVLTNTGDMALMTLRGGAIQSAKDFNRTLKLAVKGKKIPVYGRRFKVTSQFVEGPKGSYYVPKFEPVGFTPANVYAECVKLYANYENKSFAPNVPDTDEIHEAGEEGGI